MEFYVLPEQFGFLSLLLLGVPIDRFTANFPKGDLLEIESFLAFCVDLSWKMFVLMERLGLHQEISFCNLRLRF
jgi:hypothetical protein